MADTQRKLYDLGIFSQVDMAIQNPDGDEDRKYVALRSGRGAPVLHHDRLRLAVRAHRRKQLRLRIFPTRRRAGRESAGFPRTEPAEPFRPGTNADAVQAGGLPRCKRARCRNYFVPKIFNLPKFDATFSISVRRHVRRPDLPVETGGSAPSNSRNIVSKPITIFYDFTYRHVGVRT